MVGISDDEVKGTLPVGHPEAGYITPEPGQSIGTGTLPPEEQDAIDELTADWEAEVDAVAEHEDTVARSEAGIADEKKTTKSTNKETSGKS